MIDEFEVEELRAQVRNERRVVRNSYLDDRDPDRDEDDDPDRDEDDDGQ